MNSKTLDVNLINPFILATIAVLESMAGLRPIRTGMHLKQKDECCFGDISGVVGFAGDITGNLAVSFPKDVGLKIIAGMIEETPEWDSKYVKEGIGEIANMIAGHAKGNVSASLGYLYQISLPSVISGKNHYVGHPSSMAVMVVEFTISGLGIFTMELCVKK